MSHFVPNVSVYTEFNSKEETLITVQRFWLCRRLKQRAKKHIENVNVQVKRNAKVKFILIVQIQHYYSKMITIIIWAMLYLLKFEFLKKKFVIELLSAMKVHKLLLILA